jgi:hypothetical protein
MESCGPEKAFVSRVFLITKRRNLMLAPAPLPSFAAHFKPDQMFITIPYLTGE